MPSITSPWFGLYQQPTDKHWKVYCRIETDLDLQEMFGPGLFPQLPRMAVPADNYADMPEYVQYSKLIKEPKVMYALPGKIYPQFATGSFVLRLVNSYHKGKKARKGQE